MGFLNLASHLIINNITGIAIGAIGTVVMSKLIGIVWEYLKPIEDFTNYAEIKSKNFGDKTRIFLFKRMGHTKEAKKILKDLENSSEKIQDAYVKGLRGE